MSSDVAVLLLTSDMTVAVENLRDELTGALVTGATVTARLLTDAGAGVAGQADPFTLSAVAGFSGFYRGNIVDTASLAVGDTGTVVITATDGASVRTFIEPYVVRNG
jgi:hypothetical protein